MRPEEGPRGVQTTVDPPPGVSEGAHLRALIPLIQEPPEVKHHVPGESLQLLGRHVRELQPLQVKHILLVVGHLWAHTAGLQRQAGSTPLPTAWRQGSQSTHSTVIIGKFPAVSEGSISKCQLFS